MLAASRAVIVMTLAPDSSVRLADQLVVPVAVSQHLRVSDTVALTHRGHGQALAKGVDLAGFFAEMMGKANGLCGGLGGSMHIADFSVGMLGANGVVAAGLPIAVGAAHEAVADESDADLFLWHNALFVRDEF